MQTIATTRLSSKGQIVIPEEIRERLNLEAGTQFVVVGEGDAVILRVISPPSKAEVATLLAKALTQTKKAGMKHKDVEKAIRRVRKSR
jgi:AbrB family looped-hinge helix DNA binding protein